MSLDQVRAHLRGHFAASGVDSEPDSASVTFLGTESIEVLRFRSPDGVVRYVSVGCSRHPMSDPTQIQVDQGGQISATVGDATEKSVLGTIELSTFPSPEGLQSVGNNNFVPTGASGDPSIGKADENGAGTLLQGSLEGSNVDMVAEMATLVLAQRAYQLNARVLQASDQILDTINNLRQ